MTTQPRKSLSFHASVHLERELQNIAKATDYEVVQLIRQAVLENDSLRGIKPPEAGPAFINFRIRGDHNQKIEDMAAAAKISKSQALRVLCQLAIDKNKKSI